MQAQTYSDYKHHHTAKILVSIIPTGAFNFVSKAWGGRTSDHHITVHSGFLDIIENNDGVMADRGFSIEDEFVVRKAYLHNPPGRRGTKQMSKAQVEKTKKIANRQIFVKQEIRRLKKFRILKYELPISLAPQLDDIVTISAATCNLYPPLTR